MEMMYDTLSSRVEADGLDEKLVYYVGMSVDDGSSSESDEVSPELKQFLSHLKVCLRITRNYAGEDPLTSVVEYERFILASAIGSSAPS